MLRSKFLQLWLALLLTVVYCSDSDRYLFLPDPEKCRNRYQQGDKYEGRNFFYSGHVPELAELKVDWLDARNTCRERCMETVTFDIEKKFDFFKKYIMEKDIKFIWTSGRLCDFAGCEGRWDLLPKIIKAWLWTANQVQLPPTNVKPPDWTYQPWSRTGHRKLPQPDDAEFFINQIHEGCLGVLNNMYNDSVAFHDIGCHHKTRFICEDSEELLEQVIEIEKQQAEEKVRKAAEAEAKKNEPVVEKVTNPTKVYKPRTVVNSTTKTATTRTSTSTTQLPPKTTTILPETVQPDPEEDDEDYDEDETTTSSP